MERIYRELLLETNDKRSLRELLLETKDKRSNKKGKTVGGKGKSSTSGDDVHGKRLAAAAPSGGRDVSGSGSGAGYERPLSPLVPAEKLFFLSAPSSDNIIASGREESSGVDSGDKDVRPDSDVSELVEKASKAFGEGARVSSPSVSNAALFGMGEEGCFAQTGSGFFVGLADEVYAQIRANNDDVKSISRATGIKEKNILKVKDHLFNNKHLLDRYVKYGIPAEMKRFDSDLAIANAWKRLELGVFNSKDIQLLKHEAAEAWYMRKHGPSYTNAHAAANRRYPAPEFEEIFNEMEKFNSKEFRR